MGSFSQTIQQSHAKKLKLNGEIGGHVIQLVARENVKGKKSKFFLTFIYYIIINIIKNIVKYKISVKKYFYF